VKKRTKLAAGAGAALAVVEDAAKQLGVDPAKLNEALRQALENRIDEAVKAGDLTVEQGQAMKQRLEADDFPLFGGPGFGHRGFAHRGFRDLGAAAAFLGVEEAALQARLRDGDTLAEVAKDEGKSVDGLVSAIVAATTKRIDEAVAAGRITKAQRDEIVSGLKERTTAIVNGDFPALRGRGGPGLHGPGFDFGFGAPRPEPPRPA
jgi:polyhydroxyalkanoate synthesis regulator phasin